ncbi:MAG: D-cysteine desulfhydrase [Phycisphaerae bacterium]|nr:D-cysteine desulfhydrase [Phycisphaerae bacterium]
MPLDRLSARLNGAAILLKRDDLTGLETSGNKVRKLEYVVAEAIAAGCDTLVTEGTPQSNHCRATAAACARSGLRCVLLLRPEPHGAPQGNHLLDVLFGAEIRSYPRPQFDEQRETIVAGVLEELRAAGRRPRWTPMGASDPLGCWGYIRGIAELAVQIHARGIQACDLLVAVSSGGTYAGLLLGKLLHRLTHVALWGVPVSDDVAHHQRLAAGLCRATIAQYALPIEFHESDLAFVDGYVGPGYARPYPAALAAIRELASSEAIVLDPVYTGKAFCALLDGARGGRFGRERPVIFIHTGGIFSDFAWPEQLASERR